MMIVLMMGTVSVLPTFSADEDPSRRGPSPVAEGVPWIDSLDDLSHVYVPTGGLVGVEVGGGDAHLKSGAQTGWLASETLTSSPGYYYDQVVLEVDAPGDSRVLVSILDASAEPDEVGFANGTIGAYKLRGELDLVLVALSPDLYPSIRIQVSLEASGTDLPRLLSWSLFFTSRGEWRDDFRGPSKIVEQNHINFTGEALEVDLSKPAIGGPGVGEYDPYPTIAMAEGTTAAFLYPDAGHTSYQDELIPFRDFASAVTIHDLDLDGYLDLVIANSSDDSAIYWGDPSGVFSPSKKQVLDTESARNVAVGDFNGDGWPDIIFAEISKAVVFTNDGGGTIPDQPDVTISSPTQSAFVGDFDGDSYEDVLLTYSDGSIYHGGPQGLSPTESVTLPGSFWTVADLDKDGRSDVVAYDTSTGLNVFLGGTSGIDTVADYTLTVDNTAYYPTTGDMNGDGYVDIVVNDHQGAGVYAIKAFEGDATGWSSDRTHVLTTGPWSRLVAGDVDKDGSDDLLYTKFESPSFRMEIYGGGGTWNFTRFTQKNLTRNVVDTAIAVPRGGNLPRAYRGILTTVPITVPQDRKWDVVHLDGTFPSNTSTRVSVLDGTSGRVMTGYKDLPTLNVDLSDIDPSAHRTISLKVTILTDVNTTTPVLDSLSVEWLSVREWRDEFYGPNRVDGVLNIVPSGGSLHRGAIGGSGPQLVFPSLLGDDNYTTTATAYFDDGGADYLARTPLDFRVRGAVDADAADVNGDGYMDIAFAVHQADEVTFATTSPLILGGPLGLEGSPSHGFDTVGASAVVLRDIDGDGLVDAVFSQERRAVNDYSVGSVLYWGSEEGFAAEPDLVFATVGASDVDAVDVNGDDRLDLVFASYRDASSTSTGSMVFLQDGTEGFCATAPDHLLPTKGARAVATGDIDGDGQVDLVFANSLAGGVAELDSYVYWGMAGGGFETTPLGLPTSGAQDVLVSDLNGDGDLDLAFANHWDNGLDPEVDSYVFLGDGTRDIGPSPDARLPTVGATGVAAADIDGSGWTDLVFANQRGPDSFMVPSYIYLGGAAGWPPAPDVELPTEGASSVLAVELIAYGTGGYLSQAVQIDEPARGTGTMHTLRYTATLGAAQSADLMVVDASTMEDLGRTPVTTGTHEWDLTGMFRVSEHRVVRIVVTAAGLEAPGQFSLDSIWFNWTERVEAPPVVVGLDTSAPSVLRTRSVTVLFDVTDEYDLPGDLVITVQERPTGSETWSEGLVRDLSYDRASEAWTGTVTPKVDVPPGLYDIRVTARDLDGQISEWVEFPRALEVLNNLPTRPVVAITPEQALTTSSLVVEVTTRSMDVETTGLTYNYTWYRDGVPVPEVSGDGVPTYLTAKGENWTVEVRAWDGDGFSEAGTSSVVILNSPPVRRDVIPDPEIFEDTTDDEWIDLTNAFHDADGDPISWSLAREPVNVTVAIDHGSGRVTITPRPDWFGEEDVTFVGSDGEATASQTVTVVVLSVNDPPVITTIDGEPFKGKEYSYTINQGEPITITYSYSDVEGDEVQADVSIPTVDLDEASRTITFDPGTDAVGTFTFTFRLWDVESPDQRQSISFTIEVLNENDPMEDPVINQPAAGSRYRVNQSFSLVASVFDPDVQYGQVLNFTWTSNVSGLLGYGSSLPVALLQPGTHLITLTVSDGEFEKSATVEVGIDPVGGTEPPPEPDGGDGGSDSNWVLIVGIIVALAIVMAVLFVIVGRRKTDAFEKEMDELEEAETKKEALERTRDAIKDLADEWEGKATTRETAATAEAAGWEVEGGTDDIEVTSSEVTLSMEARVTEEASDEVRRLWSGVGATDAKDLTEEEREALRIENEKRQFQNTIGRLPYGIPSKELAGWDWVDLAACLAATCERKTLEDGRQVVNIEGRWYYLDRGDMSSFLREHGREERKQAVERPVSDRERLLAKLEERFILGEISEATYHELKRKYGG